MLGQLPLIALLFALIAAPFVVLFTAQASSLKASGDWHAHHSTTKRQLVDGTLASGELMRRRMGGQWQYRLQTKDEEAELSASTGW